MAFIHKPGSGLEESEGVTVLRTEPAASCDSSEATFASSSVMRVASDMKGVR